MNTRLAASAIVLLLCAPSFAHRLDEYLQGTLVSIGKSRFDAEITLTPGVAILPILLADIDADRDGVLSAGEQQAYAARVLRDLSVAIDGHRLTPSVISARFPAIEEMREGRGEIRIEFSAELPRGGPNRSLVLENHHQSRIAAYQVNCLVPGDPDIRIVAQKRNYSQSYYRVDYVQAGVRPSSLPFANWFRDGGWLAAIALLLAARFAFLWLRARRKAWEELPVS